MTGVLVDTSVWARHFRRADAVLQSLALSDSLLSHPLVVLELACGTPPVPRERTLADISALRPAAIATSSEAMDLLRTERLHDAGCGAVDVLLLASTRLTPGARLWTDDRALLALARRLGVAFEPARH